MQRLLERVQNHKYLGIDIDNKLRLNENTEILS